MQRDDSGAVVPLPVPHVDSHEAARFLRRLTGRDDAPAHFQTFDDSDAKRPTLARSRCQSLASMLTAVNGLQARGAGVFVGVNAMRGSRRSKAHFAHSCAVFVDDDTRRSEPITDWPIAPHMVVESSPGKFHYYWFTHTDDADEWLAVMKGIASRYGTDATVCTLERVMRLPGSWHLKDPSAPHRVRIVWIDDERPAYPWAEIVAAFPIDNPTRTATDEPQVDRADIGALLATIANAEPGVHDAMTRAAAHLAAHCVPQSTTLALLSALLDKGDDGSPRMRSHRADLPRIVASGYGKFYFPGDDIEARAPDPLDMFAAPGTQPEFDLRDYPPVIANLAADIARRMGCDPITAAWTAIVVAAALIDDAVTVQVKANDTTWRESARLWVAILGDPSTKKSPPMSAVLVAVRKLEAALWADFKVRFAQWEMQAAEAKKVSRPEPDRPTAERIAVNDTTIEALFGVLSGNPAGVLAVHDELSGWFGSHDAYRPAGTSKDRAFYLTAYNGGGYIVDRVKAGTQFIANASLCILGGIQPDPMRRIAGKLDDDGLLQRFVVLPVAPATAGADVAADTAALAAWDAAVRRLYESRDGLFGAWPRVVRFDPAAQVLIDDARARLYTLARNPTTDRKFGAALAKGEAQLARIALVFHCLSDTAGPDGRAPGATIVARTAAMAVRVFERLVVPAAASFYADIVGVSESHTDARWIAGYVLAHRLETVAARDLYRAARDLRGDDGKHRIAAAMSQLELAGWVHARLSERRGAVTAWTVNPRVHVLFAAVAERERVRRAAVVAGIRKGVE
jgi:hypothetical protein